MENNFLSLKLLKGFIFVVCLITFAVSPAKAAQHRYHTSLTRIDYNEREKLAEITIQLFTHDLVPTLERRSKKKIDLENTPDIDNLIFEYINKNFVLTDQENKQKKLNWVGKELEVDVVYVYLETPFIEGLKSASLKNTIFFEGFPEQTNLVTARFEGKKSDLLFKVGDKFKGIFSPLSEGKK